MDEETTGFWMVALGAATASGTWEGFRISPLRHTASLHVDGALTVKDDHPKSRDYALVLSHPSVDRDRILVAGRSGTIEFGHDLVDSLTREKPGISPTLWLADLTTGECSERCELPRAPRALPPAARPADPQIEVGPADTGIDSGIGAGVRTGIGAGAEPAIGSHAAAAVEPYVPPVADPSPIPAAIPAAVPAAALTAAPATAPAVALAADRSTTALSPIPLSPTPLSSATDSSTIPLSSATDSSTTDRSSTEPPTTDPSTGRRVDMSVDRL